jgi:hypothetical protein
MPELTPGVVDALNALSRSTRRVSMAISSDEESDLVTEVGAIASALTARHPSGGANSRLSLGEAIIWSGDAIREGLIEVAAAIRDREVSS